MAVEKLGEFEHMVLSVVLRLGNGPYGREIRQELEALSGRTVSSGALSVTIDRLEQKGYVESELRDPDPGRGGRPRRYVTVTESGMAAVRETRETLLRIWEGIEPLLEGS